LEEGTEERKNKIRDESWKGKIINEERKMPVM
jgi:hypothetical protein